MTLAPDDGESFKALEGQQILAPEDDYCMTPGKLHSSAYYEGMECSVCHWQKKDPNAKESKRPIRYPDLDSIKLLRNGGRELLGKPLYATEKRDGSNIMIWMKTTEETQYNDGTLTVSIIQVSSRNMDTADSKLQAMLFRTAEWPKIQQMLRDQPQWVLFVELIPEGLGPTRLEPKHKKPSAVLFDIWSGTFLNYTFIYQMAFHYRIPVVKLVEYLPEVRSLEELETWRQSLLKWARKHKREGVVIKWYGNHKGDPENGDYVFAKEKVDMPERPKLQRGTSGKVELPVLPPSEVFGAISKVAADQGLTGDKAHDMPLVAKYIAEEAKKHYCRAPTNIFAFYMDYIAGRKATQ